MEEKQVESNQKQVSYCIGLETGKNLKQQFSDMNFDQFKEGFEDAITGKKPRLEENEIKNIMNALRHHVEQQQKDFISKVSAHNKKTGEEFLAKNKHQPSITTLASGLQYEIVKSGEGASPSPTDVVSVHYKGTFLEGEEFDSSYKRGQPHSFAVNRVIPGWTEALQLMKVGDVWKLYIPSYLAYGEAGFPPHIGPNMTLLFEIELLGIN